MLGTVYFMAQLESSWLLEDKEDEGLQWGDYILATNNLNIIEIIDIFEFKNYSYICNSKSKKNLC